MPRLAFQPGWFVLKLGPYREKCLPKGQYFTQHWYLIVFSEPRVPETLKVQEIDVMRILPVLFNFFQCVLQGNFSLVVSVIVL